MHADELRKLAALIKEAEETQEVARTQKAAHLLIAAKGLMAMSAKKKGWYDTQL